MPEPEVSVVITVKDDVRVLDCVDAVLQEHTPFSFDVVVVDNESKGGLFNRLRERYGSSPRVTLVRSGGNLSESWNAGARAAGAPVLVRIDADAVPSAGWLTALVAPIRDGGADWTAGPVGGIDAGQSLAARYFESRTDAYSRRLARDLQLRDAVPSWNVAYRRTALEAAGWYDPWQASSVDWDLHKRLGLAGCKGEFALDARVLHHHPTTIRELLRKEAWYRTGQYQMALKYGMREMLPAFLLPGAYVLLIILALAGFLAPISWWLALLLLAALVAKHWIEGVRERDPMWTYRAVFRPLEGIAGAYGILRGVARYGIRHRA